LGADNPMRMYIDTPLQAKRLSGVTQLSGWAVDDEAGMAGVGILIDGVSYGQAGYGGSRPDVAAYFRSRRMSERGLEFLRLTRRVWETARIRWWCRHVARRPALDDLDHVPRCESFR